MYTNSADILLENLTYTYCVYFVLFNNKKSSNNKFVLRKRTEKIFCFRIILASL